MTIFYCQKPPIQEVIAIGAGRHRDTRLISISILQRETEIQEEKYLTHRP